jgi:branched-chain amino acid transport system permease protein
MSGALSARSFALWGALALFVILLPQVVKQSAMIGLFNQMGIAIIFALSYNMIFGQTGMLSFGHAVYSGLGAYLAIHALNLVGQGKLAIPVALIPLVGGLGGLFFGLLFGYVTTKRAGTTFAMISLGIAEMVASMSLMFPGFFGGEAGISGNRAAGQPFLGINFGSPTQVYYLIAAWTALCTTLMYGITRTPLGRMANAVRDNPERAEFVGYDTQRVRFLMLLLSAGFAGIAGGLSAINFEIVTAENVGPVRSGEVLFMAFLGGAGSFYGPIIGAILVTFLQVMLSGFTKAWLLYLGMFFLAMVLFAPGGIAGIISLHRPIWARGFMGKLVPSYLAILGAGLVILSGVVMLIEMIYHWSENGALDPVMKLVGVSLTLTSVVPWLVAVVIMLAGAFLFRLASGSAKKSWERLTGEAAEGAIS